MARDRTKLVLLSVKMEAELAELLERIPNRSELIRRAIAAMLRVACPLCRGKGILSPALHDFVAPKLSVILSCPCAGCGQQRSLTQDVEHLGPDDRARLEQYFAGEPFFCGPCSRTQKTKRGPTTSSLENG